MCDTTVKRQKIDKLFVDIPEQEQVLYWVVVEITTFFGMKTEIVYNNLRHIIAAEIEVNKRHVGLMCQSLCFKYFCNVQKLIGIIS